MSSESDKSESAIPATHAPAAHPLVTALKHAIAQPQFLATIIVLTVAALSLGAATQYLRLYFKKEAVPIAPPLDQIPPSLGPWVQVSKDEALDPEMLDILGTKQYIFRDYIDTRLIDSAQITALKEATTRDRAQILATIVARKPEASIRASVTYYTGMVDTVAHIPDRCYVANGDVAESKETPTWTLVNKDHKQVPITVSLIHFEDGAENRAPVTKNVAYFFQCNGEYEYDPIRGVRIRLQNLAERHAYYAKVEVMTEMHDKEKSTQVMQDFLCSALPEVERCLPDWKQVQAGTYVPATAAKSVASK